MSLICEKIVKTYSGKDVLQSVCKQTSKRGQFTP